MSLRLYAMGARVTVAARKEGDRAMATALGLEALDFPQLPETMADYDFIVNSVPEQVLGEQELNLVRRDALLLELASAPGGFDMRQADELGLKALAAPGLPGLCAPYTAAELMRDTIYSVIREREE